MANVAFTPKTPDLADIAERKADIALVTSSPAIPTWEGDRETRFAAFRELGELGAKGAVSLVQVFHGFAAGVAAGAWTAANADLAYGAYATAYNVACDAMPSRMGAKRYEMSGDSFKASVSTMRSYGETGAVAQGATVTDRDSKGRATAIDWSPAFYDRIADIYGKMAEDERVDGLQKAFYRANQMARDLGKDHVGCPWTVRALTSDEIADCCAKPVNAANAFAKLIKALEGAAKKGAKLEGSIGDILVSAIADVKDAYNQKLASEDAANRAQDLLKGASIKRFDALAKAKA